MIVSAVHYLCLKTGRILEHVEQFRVVDLQQHSCDLACPLTVLALWENMCKKIDPAGEEQMRPKEMIKAVEGHQVLIPKWKII